MLTTEPCLLNPNRNPQLSQADVERYLADFCCAKKILWLRGGIAGDDTVLVVTRDPLGGEAVAARFLALAAGQT